MNTEEISKTKPDIFQRSAYYLTQSRGKILAMNTGAAFTIVAISWFGLFWNVWDYL